MLQVTLVFVAYLGSVASILSVCHLLDEQRAERFEQFRARLGKQLSEITSLELSFWMRQANQAFLNFYDILYGSRPSLINQTIWSGLILSPLVLSLFRIAFLTNGDTDLRSSHLLLLAIGAAIAIALGIGIARGLAEALGIEKVLFGVIMASLGISYISGPEVFEHVLAALLTLSLIRIVGNIAGRVGLAAAIVGAIIAIAAGATRGNAIAVAIGTSIAIGTTTGIGTDSLFQMSVHPLKAMVSSMLFVTIVGVIRIDATNSFIAAVETEGLEITAFVAFNLFADGLSLVETRWVLQRGADARWLKLLGLLVLDLLLSAALFLFLPIVLWELPAFFEAVLFRGTRPWLGILFWSTFSTSVLFYAFVISVLTLVYPIVGINKASRWAVSMFDIEQQPFWCIGIVTCMLITLLTIIGAAVHLLMALL